VLLLLFAHASCLVQWRMEIQNFFRQGTLNIRWRLREWREFILSPAADWGPGERRKLSQRGLGTNDFWTFHTQFCAMVLLLLINWLIDWLIDWLCLDIGAILAHGNTGAAQPQTASPWSPDLWKLHWLPITDTVAYKHCLWLTRHYSDTRRSTPQTYWCPLPTSSA